MKREALRAVGSFRNSGTREPRRRDGAKEDAKVGSFCAGTNRNEAERWCCARLMGRKKLRTGRGFSEGVETAGVVAGVVQEVDKKPRPNRVLFVSERVRGV